MLPLADLRAEADEAARWRREVEVLLALALDWLHVQQLRHEHRVHAAVGKQSRTQCRLACRHGVDKANTPWLHARVNILST